MHALYFTCEKGTPVFAVRLFFSMSFQFDVQIVNYIETDRVVSRMMRDAIETAVLGGFLAVCSSRLINRVFEGAN